MGIVSLELAGTPDRANDIFNAWSPGLIGRAITNTYIDFLFVLSYGCLLYSLCITLSRRHTGPWRLAGRWLGRAMVVAACFDAIENILLIKTLNGSMGKELIASTFMFASLKFFLIVIGVVYILISLAGMAVKSKPVQEQALS